MRNVVLPLVLGVSFLTGCTVTAKTQTRYTRDLTSQTSTATWSGQAITLDDAALDIIENGGLTVTGDPAATNITVTGRAVAYADSTDQASANTSLDEVVATVQITQDSSGNFTVSCGHAAAAHGTSSVANTGCEALQVTVPAGSVATPLNLTAKVGSGDVTITGTTGWLSVNDNGTGDITASHTPTKDSQISLVGGFGVSLAVPSTFAADTITLTADTPSDVDTSAFPGVTNGKGYGTAGTGAASITLTSDGPGKVVLTSQ